MTGRRYSEADSGIFAAFWIRLTFDSVHQFIDFLQLKRDEHQKIKSPIDVLHFNTEIVPSH